MMNCSVNWLYFIGRIIQNIDFFAALDENSINNDKSAVHISNGTFVLGLEAYGG